MLPHSVRVSWVRGLMRDWKKDFTKQNREGVGGGRGVRKRLPVARGLNRASLHGSPWIVNILLSKI